MTAHQYTHPIPPSKVSFIHQLRLNDFRNYEKAQLTTSAKCNILIGGNGSGKTNILEAMSLLSPGRGLRRAPYADLIFINNSSASRPWIISSDVWLENEERVDKIGSSWAYGTQQSRTVRINGEDVSADQLSDYMRILWLTPSMDGLFMGAGGDRRRFLDRLVLTLDTSHGKRVSHFEKIMRQRNKLLEDFDADPHWLSALEQQMAELASAIILARLECISLLKALMLQWQNNSPFPWADLNIQGDLENNLAQFTATDVEDDYMRVLYQQRGADRRAGRTLLGPHRSDFIVTHGPKDMLARLSSTGEQKALLISLILAHTYLVRKTCGFTPILLLDEITAHLDETRRHSLFDQLQDIGGQVWLTGTDLNDFQGCQSDARFFQIHEDSFSGDSTKITSF